MAKIHVLLKKEELDGERLPGKLVVVLDVLFATSTIVTALSHGAAEVIPTLSGEAALEEGRKLAEGTYVLSGELHAETLPGFAHPTPLALLEHDLRGKTLVYSTTNGTVALAKAADADLVVAAALLNAEAVVEYIRRAGGDRTVLLVCSGSADNFNLEDFYGAGYLASLLARHEGYEFSDAALAARMLYAGTKAEECLAAARVGRLVAERALRHEIDFAAGKSRFRVVPKLMDGRLRPAE